MSVASGVRLVDDRYEVGPLIGRGGMGEVYRAHDRRLRRDVAIKFLRPDLAASEAARQRFAIEAHNAARLTHPNVVLVLDSGETDGTPYIVMECLPGHTLRDELADGPLDPARATWIARDVLAGLAAAHELGIVHRDVSPGNILMTETGRAKLADFGIAKAGETPSVTVVGQVLGTPAYLSPERLKGEPATPASDVYGVGATLYEALAGQPPFRGESAVAVAHQVVTGTPERLEHLRPDAPVDLVAAIDLAMDPDPSRRPTADALRGVLAGDEPLSAETSALPIVDAGSQTQAVPMTRTVAVGAVVPPADRIARTWRERRAMLVTVGIAALVGLLLFAASDHSGSTGTPSADTTVPTTIAPVPTTFAPPVTASVANQPVQQVQVRRGGHGHRGKH